MQSTIQTSEMPINDQINDQEPVDKEVNKNINIEFQDLLNADESPSYDDADDLSKLDEAVSGDNDLKKCDSIEDKVLKAFCIKDIITTIAMENNDVSKCNELTGEEDKQYCLDKVASLKSE